MAKTGSILELPLEEWDQSWAVDVQAAVLGIKAFLPGMFEKKRWNHCYNYFWRRNTLFSSVFGFESCFEISWSFFGR